MPYLKPVLALIDYRSSPLTAPSSTKVTYPVTEPLPNLELRWNDGHFQSQTPGQSLLVRLGLTVSMTWRDQDVGGTRFVVTIERPGHLGESEIARGDVSSLRNQRQGFVLEAHYGPISPPTNDDSIVFRARWATLSGGTSFLERGDLGSTELRAYGYLVSSGSQASN